MAGIETPAVTDQQEITIDTTIPETETEAIPQSFPSPTESTTSTITTATIEPASFKDDTPRGADSPVTVPSMKTHLLSDVSVYSPKAHLEKAGSLMKKTAGKIRSMVDSAASSSSSANNSPKNGEKSSSSSSSAKGKKKGRKNKAAAAVVQAATTGSD